MKIVIIGGVAAGASAATKARRTNEHAQIVLFEQGEYVSFANCGLPYYVGGTIPKRDSLLVVREELFRKRYNIDVRTLSQVTKINRNRKTVTVLDKRNNTTYEERYDKLIIATGARPFVLPFLKDCKNSYTCFTLYDVDKIKETLSAAPVKKAIVIGAGYIGMELAEQLNLLGLDCTIVELKSSILPQFDKEITNPVVYTLKEKGIDVKTGVSVVDADVVDGIVKRLKLSNGEEIECDVVFQTAGVIPNVELAREAGLEVNRGIVVNNKMQTSDPDIYAAGDAVEVKSIITGKNVWIPLAGPANKQGRVAGCNAAGGNLEFKGVIGSSIIKVFDWALAKVGLGEAECKDQGIDYNVTIVHPLHHAGYYPGGKQLTIKLIFDNSTGRIYGAQVVGKEGVDKRADVIATAIYAGLTVFDLENLDLVYAPPFSSAKDPVIMAGMTASNIIRGEVKNILPDRVFELLDNPEYLILDVRTPEEYEFGHIKRAINIPVDELRNRLSELPKDKKIIVYCGVGFRSYHGCLILKANGFDCLNMSGGWTSWRMYYPDMVE
ncbi:NADPH-dependent 2,4-dienoyl-CoA reductase/sulfur reductase-like enzyme [Caldicellulosiruptor bescii]|uniref:FAD-dependent pyridine nucleotide-disulphide oxidoreductase n=2 Tax=Caldicellulosiruptor bescii TaxID=31899 RepID=B9MJW3_CALBD|nr:FAD-dependent oxidoreductase [Caldicellulosiruptor bescii]ACM60621.1 FAD-dependent pyridine nucleotide-disulphide oxidoreductase [Caldicellulosiruptor bescii DSM 6725]PBC88030.1 NADPH-dependent 2,4-dienoyl-CoA reductase/sulfur reductase-like enzyme [Caldicellulosiruptor bescii]PBC90962.1 NADPH-dependent 2,4-dienoyl-CoA reductase/sulfur reductase-like enzyme [Caldicellulosiruptor bescii]PBD06760.1 NADPH-dependent 2,4-dienoyl-CoA reductase/sulfur reductase-like enzyme [Caldicellulosiruptor bes